MGIDLELDDEQLAIRDAVSRFCAQRCPQAVARADDGPPPGLWRELAELGVLALATPDGEGGATHAVAALEALGAAAFPGPLAATFFAAQLLRGSERAAVVSGAQLVSVGTPPIMPFAGRAGIFIAVEGARAWRATPAGDVLPLRTLGGEPWGRVACERGEALEPTRRAHALHDVAMAAFAAAAGQRLVRDAAAHARTRVQFGRPIGDFQAVAHPLADASVRLDAAATLARAAACAFDADPQADATRAAAAAARLSARAASLDAVHTAHQVFGAVGITLEGPAFFVSRRLRQLASQAPGDAPAREALLHESLPEVA